jgi:(p)ppGpp synthase/HD superfamily hydrolase
MTDFKIVSDYAEKCHNAAGCTYGDDESYMVHVNAVVGIVVLHKNIFKNPIDRDITITAAFCHDLIEDTKESFNEVSSVIGVDAADVVLAVTDVSAENRLMKHLLTMGKY